MFVVIAPLTTFGALARLGPSDAAEVDLQYAALTFDYTKHANISPLSPDCSGSAPCVGKTPGDIVRFDTVATVGGTAIDAVVTTESCTTATVTRYEVASSWVTHDEYFRVRQDITAGGMCTYRFEFFVGGTYSGPGTGAPLTVRNLRLTALEIDNRQ